MKRAFVVLVSLLISCFVAQAGRVNPGLNAAYGNRGATETLPVLIALSDELAASDMVDHFQYSGMSLPDIHTQLMNSLTVRATIAQAPVLKSLDILKSTGMASNIRPFWLSNVLAADLTKAGAELVANMAEVSEVGLDETITLRASVESTPAQAVRGVESGLLQSGVRDLWNGGLYGKGHVLCVIGDGVDAAHPALAAHWRGRDADPAACWFDLTGSSAPANCGAEGTHMAGILCGADTQSGDTIGIAPAAKWIAARLFCGSARFSDMLSALQWAADPDGQSGTFYDVPDAICCAWGMDSECMGSVPEGAWHAVANLELLGPVAVFAVSNYGAQGSGSVRAPETLAECFSVGNAKLTGTSPSVHPASGRGPSLCDPALIKPDMVAPGTAVRTAMPNGYSLATGTGIAAAHVAGTVGLLREANPNLSAAELRRILTASTTAMGGVGANNVSGAGLLNASAAYVMAQSASNTGTLMGVVRYGGEPVSGARILLSSRSGNMEATTIGGYFTLDHVPADRSYAVGAGRFGYSYYLRSDSITVAAGTTTNLYINLERGFDDNAQYDQGWRLGVEGDNASGGMWVRGKPVGSKMNGKLVQPDTDAPPSEGFCFVTGNASSENADPMEADVDGGHTTLRSPQFNLLGFADPVLHFSYWFSNDQGPNPGSDFFSVQISNDGGQKWVNIINTATSTIGWTRINVPVSDFVTSSGQMVLQFVATDDPPASLVEAAVDNISITGAATTPEPPRDLMIDVQSDFVVLRWRASSGAGGYKVYLSGNPDRVVVPENLYTTTNDTTITVPMSSIPFNEFYFQVTAAK
jgi:hypothetical protein